MHKGLRPVSIMLSCLLFSACATHTLEPTSQSDSGSVPGRTNTAIESKREIQSVVTHVNPKTGQVERLPRGSQIFALRGFVVRDGTRDYNFIPPSKYTVSSSGLTVQYGGGHVQRFSSAAYVESSARLVQYIVVYPGQSPMGELSGQRPVYVVK